jgi:hypothetical protein
VMALLEREGININWQNKAVGNVRFAHPLQQTPSHSSLRRYACIENGPTHRCGKGQHNSCCPLARPRRRGAAAVLLCHALLAPTALLTPVYMKRCTFGMGRARPR